MTKNAIRTAKHNFANDVAGAGGVWCFVHGGGQNLKSRHCSASAAAAMATHHNTHCRLAGAGCSCESPGSVVGQLAVLSWHRRRDQSASTDTGRIIRCSLAPPPRPPAHLSRVVGEVTANSNAQTRMELGGKHTSSSRSRASRIRTRGSAVGR